MAKALMENPFLSELWELCLSVSVVILLLLLIRPLMKRIPRIGMYILWVMVVLRIAFPYPVSGIQEFLPVSVGQTIADVKQKAELDRLTETSVQKEHYGGPENGYRLKPEVVAAFQKESGEIQTGVSTGNSNEKTTGLTGEQKIPHTKLHVKPEWVVLSVWFAGVLFCLVYLCRSLFCNRRHFRNAVHLFDNVYEHHDACGSFVGGIISPKIYVPSGMDADALEYILVHERIHIRRWDYRIKPFAFLAFSVLWFNPLVWIAYRLMTTDMEISCDEAVIRQMGENSRKRYSYLLLAMASGENRAIRSNAAFGAGVVKERIHHVMKYKRPTKCMTAVLITAVVLCGCGIVSSNPPETVNELSQENESGMESDEVYVEQTVAGDTIDWDDEEGVEGGRGCIKVNRQGKIVMILELEKLPDEKRVSFAKEVLADGKWQKEEITWGKELNKRLDGKNAELENIYYDADGKLYLAFTDYSLPYEEYEKNEGDKYTEDDWYAVDQLLYRIDEETGEITEIDVPVEKEGDRALWNDYGFFADGNYFVSSKNTFVIYNSRTGEQVAADIDIPEKQWGMPFTGDDYVVWWTFNEETDAVEFHVYDEFGESSYKLTPPAPLKYDKEKKMDPHDISVSGDTIVLATRDGIFEAKYEDEEFHNVISPEKDNLYYFTPDMYEPSGGGLFKGGQEDYLLMLENEDGEKYMDCYYKKM